MILTDGYYLFVYSQIDPVLNVLALSLRHDHNLSVFQKEGNQVRLICHLEFERFSGIKHHDVAFYDNQEATQFINTLLAPYNLTLDSFVGVYGMPGLGANTEEIEYTSISDIPNISYHAVAHLFTSMLMDTDTFYTRDILALSFDGGPDNLVDIDVDNKYSFCGAVSQKGKVTYFPISSPGGYWQYISEYFNMPEGTLMALAYATSARSLESFAQLPDYTQASHQAKSIAAINKIISRVMEYTKDDLNIYYECCNIDFEKFSEREIKISMIMKIIQEMSIQSIETQIDEILKKFLIRAEDTVLALSGGYALNCPTNTYIMNRFKFYSQKCAPCVNDGGLAIGMGLYFFHKYEPHFSYLLQSPYSGYSDMTPLSMTLQKYEQYIQKVDNTLDYVACDLLEEPLVWFDGAAEIGPRALGHRSILAHPGVMAHKDCLNQYKQREWWRPVAPIIMEEALNDWFECAFPSPFMLNNFKVQEKKASLVSAVLHMDNTARVQTVSPANDRRMYEVLARFKALTGLPIIGNTSLNDKGEPIINTFDQAFNFALRKRIRVIYINGTRILLKDHKKYVEKTYLKRDDEYFVRHEAEKERLFAKMNPHHIPVMYFLLYTFSPSLRKYDIKDKNDAEMVVKLLSKLTKLSHHLQLYGKWAQRMQISDRHERVQVLSSDT